MRPAMNKYAKYGSRCAQVAVLFFIVSFVAAFLPAVGTNRTLAFGLLGVLVLAAPFAIAAIFFGVGGVRRSSRLGGLGRSLYSIIGGVVALLYVASSIAFALIR